MSAERKVFGRLQGMAETPPDLIEIQTKSYEDFLQADVAPQKRENKGLQAIFKEIFPVVSQDARYSLASRRRAIFRRFSTARPTPVRSSRPSV